MLPSLLPRMGGAIAPQSLLRTLIRTKYNYTEQTSEQREEADSGRFKFFGAAVVERLPVLTPDAPDWYSDWLFSHIEFHQKYGRNYSYEDIVEKMKEQSQKKTLSGKKAKKAAKKEGGGGKFVVNEARLRKQLGMTPLDPGKQRQFDALLERRKVMEHNPRDTFYDKTDDRRHLYRCLDRSLYLLVEKHRAQESWQFPLAVWNEGETMRQTAERAVMDECGGQFKTYFVGNSPEGHWVHRFDEDLRQESGFDGYKIFYYRALMLGGDMNLDTEHTADYAWVAKDQLKDYFPDPQCVLYNHMLTF